ACRSASPAVRGGWSGAMFFSVAMAGRGKNPSASPRRPLPALSAGGDNAPCARGCGAILRDGGTDMTCTRLSLVLGLVGVLAGASFLARETEKAGPRMATAAGKLLGSLDDGQKKKATFDFDDKERTRWFFTPQQTAGKATRKGLPLSEMNDKQK